MTHRTAGWLVLGAALGAALRHLAATATSGLTGLVISAVLTAASGLLAGATLGLMPHRVAAVGLGVAAGVASAGIYAVLGLTADLWLGVTYVIAVPLVTAATFTAGAVLAARRRPDRTEAAS